MTGKEAAWIIMTKMMQIGMQMPIDWVKENGDGSEFIEALKMAVDLLQANDKEDNEDRQKGRWERNANDLFECSVCGWVAPKSSKYDRQIKSKYCPSCGSLMWRDQDI